MSSQFLQPSYKAGFAREASESAVPDLWRNLTGVWSAGLGPTGVTLRDWSGKHNHGTLTNVSLTTAFVVAGGERAILLDGSNDYINCGTVGTFTYPFTLMAKVRDDDYSAGDANSCAIGISTGGNSRYHALIAGNALGWSARTFDGTVRDATDPTTEVAGRTYFLVGVWDGPSSRKLYVDGRLVATNTTTANADADGGVLNISRTPDNTPIAYISGVVWLAAAWFGRALNATEIAAMAVDPYGLLRKRGFVAKAPAAVGGNNVPQKYMHYARMRAG